MFLLSEFEVDGGVGMEKLNGEVRLDVLRMVQNFYRFFLVQVLIIIFY